MEIVALKDDDGNVEMPQTETEADWEEPSKFPISQMQELIALN